MLIAGIIPANRRGERHGPESCRQGRTGDRREPRHRRGVGWLTAYLASAKADFIQGCMIDIDGGATRSL